MIPLFSVEQVREADKYAIEKLGLEGIVLMENASRSIYLAIRQHFPDLNELSQIGIIAGKGNNGGDAFALARHFINHGFAVKVVSIPSEKESKGDAEFNYKVLKNLISKTKGSKLVNFKSVRDLNVFKECDVIVDGILGTGAKGLLRSPYKEIVQKLNSFHAIKIAIDSPTGVDLHNSYAEEAFEADLTVTLAELKTGLFYGAGYKYAGTVEKGYIGIGPELFDKMDVKEYLIEPEDAFLALPVREVDDNKYSAGKVLVIAGSKNIIGAAVYSANAAIYSGAGAVYLAVPEESRIVAQTKVNSAIVSPYESNGKGVFSSSAIGELETLIEKSDVIALGPGLGREEETISAVIEMLKKYREKKFVIDADAIFALSKIKLDSVSLKNKVLTPHYGEFSALLGISNDELKKNILKYGREFAIAHKTLLVLKGAPTIIFNAKGEAFINTTGNPGMAKFGTGDVLTGIIASFIAQNKELENSVVSSVYLHSLDADILSEEMSELSITAEDLILNIPNTIDFINETFLFDSEEE